MRHRTKLPGARTVVEMLSASIGTTLMLDGSDTALLNPWASTAAPTAPNDLGDSAVLVGGECNSWPVCYGKRTLPTRRTAIANAGRVRWKRAIQMAAPSLGALRRCLLSEALEAAVTETLASPLRAEAGYDQAGPPLVPKKARRGPA